MSILVQHVYLQLCINEVYISTIILFFHRNSRYYLNCGEKVFKAELSIYHQ